jgi:hypothetical protein
MRLFMIFKRAVVFLGTVFLLSALSPAELIEPTRGLKDSAQKPGNLSVFSEPPGLQVFLNSSFMGKTPARLQNLEPRDYKLRIGDAETQIHIRSEQTQHVSFFKGNFIIIPLVQKKPFKMPSFLEKADPEPAPIRDTPSNQVKKEFSDTERLIIFKKF